MYCQDCGNQQDEGRFCRSCGRPLSRMSDERRPGLMIAEEQAPAPELSSVAVAAPNEAPLAVRSDGVGSADVTVNVPGPRIMYEDRTGPSLLLRGSYFVLIGWWIGFIWLTLASLLNFTLIGLPLGLIMINRLPLIMTLKPRSTELMLSVNADGTYALTRGHLQQHPFGVRALYFAFVGWWASFLWAWAAYGIGLLIVTLPVSFWMWNRMPAVTTLARY